MSVGWRERPASWLACYVTNGKHVCNGVRTQSKSWATNLRDILAPRTGGDVNVAVMDGSRTRPEADAGEEGLTCLTVPHHQMVRQTVAANVVTILDYSHQREMLHAVG